MELMGPEKLHATHAGGGVLTFYGVNDLVITLSEYPLGVNATVRFIKFPL